MNKVRTLHDARKEKWAQDAKQARLSPSEAARLKQNEIDKANIAFAADNGLGYVLRDGRPVFYSYPIGGQYTEAADPRDLLQGA